MTNPIEPCGPQKRAAWFVRFGVPPLILVLAVGGGVVCWTWLQPHFTAWRAWTEALQAEAEDDPARARANLELCRAAWPNSGEVHLHLAQACRRLGYVTAARQHLAEAGRLKQPNDALDLEQVMLAAQEGDLTTSEETLQALLATRRPQEAQLFEALVDAYLTLHDPRNAEAWASKWLERQPDSWRAHLSLARAREQGGDLAGGVAGYERAAQARPRDPLIQFQTGDLLRRLGRWSVALPHLQAATDAVPVKAEWALSLAQCQRALGRPDEAVRVLDQWQSGGPRPSPAPFLILRAQLELDQQRRPDALEWLRQAAASAPRDEPTLTTLSSLFRELGQADQAERFAARAWDATRKQERAASLYRLIRAQPKNPDWRQELGRVLLDVGQDEEGKRWLQSGLALDPNHKPTQHELVDDGAE